MITVKIYNVPSSINVDKKDVVEVRNIIHELNASVSLGCDGISIKEIQSLFITGFNKNDK